MDHAPKTVLLTGANGGIGRAIATRLAKDGYQLVLTDMSSCEEAIEDESLRDQIVYTGPCDLSSAEDVDRFLSETSRQVQIDALVNNAAHMGFVEFDALTPDKLHMYLRVNIEAAFQLSQFVSKNMRQRNWGRIVNIVSGSAWMPSPGMLGYITSKMGLVGLTRTLAVELAQYGICVNAVTPALTRHHRTADRIPGEIWERDKNRQAIKRTGVPEDIVGAISFLLSDDSAFMTGQTMVIDGGMVFP